MIPDLINWLDGWLGQIQHGSMHRFTFSTEADFTGADVEMILRQYGIRVWGRAVGPGDELSLLVKRKQAHWAEYILCRAGVPLTCKLLDSRNRLYQARYPPGAMPIPWTKRGIGPHTVIDYLIDWLYRLID